MSDESQTCGACGMVIAEGAPSFPSYPHPVHMFEAGCAAGTMP